MTRISGYVCKDCGQPFAMDKSEIEFFERHGLEQPKRCPECRKKRRGSKQSKECTCAKFDQEEGWKCSVTGDRCMYTIPNSKACAKDYGEGPDA